MSTLDLELSYACAAVMRPRPKDKDCFLNAFRAVTATKQATGHLPRYVEGLADGLPHAWLETDDGRILEVTPAWLDEAASHTVEYEPKRVYTILEVLAALDERGSSLPIHDLDAESIARLRQADT